MPNLLPHSPFGPKTQAFLDLLNGAGAPLLHELCVSDARKVFFQLQNKPIKKTQTYIEDYKLPLDSTGDLPIRLVRPQDINGRSPVVIFLHGGGWTLGDRYTHDRLVRELADESKTAVVVVEYTRSPEARYPLAIQEAYAAAKWIAESGLELGLDSSRLAVVGDSAGANLATALALLAKERGGPQFQLQVLFCPVTDADFDTSSYRQFTRGYGLDLETMQWFWNNYAPDSTVRLEPLASPLRASLDQLAGLPPTLLITAECDVLRDEGEAYAIRLQEAGIDVVLTRYPGTIHDFVFLNAVAEESSTRAAISQAAAALRNALY